MESQPLVRIDFDTITRLFSGAEQQGRQFLFEFETYQVLASSGAETPPQTHLLVKGGRLSDDKQSIALRMPELAARLDKPVVGVVDGGRLYDPLVDELMAKGMAVFRSSDRAV